MMNRVLSLRAYEFRLNAIELETEFEPGAAARSSATAASCSRRCSTCC